MLVFSKKRFLPESVNVMTLAKDENYFYAYRDVYDRAVELKSKYPVVEQLVNIVKCEGVDYPNEHLINWLRGSLPSPLDILAPFIILIPEPLEEDLELCVGALHIITASLNVKNLIALNKDVRREVTLSLTTREEFELDWESFFLTASDFEHRKDYLVPQPIPAPLPNVVYIQAPFQTGTMYNGPMQPVEEPKKHEVVTAAVAIAGDTKPMDVALKDGVFVIEDDESDDGFDWETDSEKKEREAKEKGEEIKDSTVRAPETIEVSNSSASSTPKDEVNEIKRMILH